MFTPEVLLTYLDGSNPKDYAVTVKVNVVETNLKLVAHRGVPTSADEEYNFLIEIDSSSETSALTELRIELGTISLHQSLGTVEVNILDDQSAVIGKKKVRAEEAQKESRPIEEPR